MTIGSIFLGLALFILVGLFIARPLLRPQARTLPRVTPYQALNAQKEAILARIRNLDFDFETGKLTESDYQRTREEYIMVAEDILRQLDEMEGSESISTEDLPGISNIPSLEDEIEQAIARRRGKAIAAIKTTEEVPAATNGKTNFCPQCGRPTDAADKFCANCGHKLLSPQRV